MTNILTVSSSPHIRSKESVNTIMRDVIIALIPAMIASVYFFRLGAVKVLFFSVLATVVTEAVIQKISKKPVTINDFSAAITGILLAFNLPSTVSWWIPVIGGAFAIAIVKQVFGGLGQNFMNPALAARAMLLASWPVQMTNWVTPGPDAVSTATPLAILKGTSESAAAMPSMMDLFVGNVGGCLGETSALLLILGGLYLIYKKVITPTIPLVYIGTVAVLMLVFSGFDFHYMMQNILAGGLMLGAFFMATDYATSPVTFKGKIIFAFGCGLITTIIRLYGGYPEGVSYSIILMNIATPLIDKYTRPNVFGGVKK
ncbi:MAG: RnfABCDGE type electron transport complex subunit D [Clostridia bacterium]|nr:RnfABCDGE type electron transport complex subunit D [Clostridia bacterium]